MPVAFALILIGAILIYGGLHNEAFGGMITGKPKPISGPIPSGAPTGAGIVTGGAATGTVPAGGTLTGTGAISPTAFATGLLQSLGDPLTQQNVNNITAWVRAEGGGGVGLQGSTNQANYNPLNTTQSGYGEVGSFGGPGIKIYPNWDQGLAATVHVLNNGLYGSILSALKQGNVPTAQFGSIVAGTQWGTSAFS